jgi:glycosyltransferase involved in cell wall biosynthesis
MNRIMHYVPYPGPEYQNKIYDVVIERSNCIFNYLQKQYFIYRYFTPSVSQRFPVELSKIKKMILKSDVIHFFDIRANSFLPYLVSKYYSKKMILDVGDLPSPFWRVVKYNKLFSYLKLPLHELMYRFSDIIIARGQTLKEYISITYGISKDKIFVVYDPINFKEIENSKNVSKIKDRLNLRGKFVIGYAGGAIFNINIEDRVIPRGFELIKAIENIFKINESYKKEIVVLFMGDGPGLEILKEYVRRNDLTRNIIFTGFVPKIKFASFINLFDVGYLETFDTPGYEAMIGAKMQYYMAASKPVITGNSGDRGILLKHQEFLLLNPCGNTLNHFHNYIDELVKRIILIYENKNMIRQIGKKNYEIANKNFSYEATAENIKKIYHRILS